MHRQFVFRLFSVITACLRLRQGLCGPAQNHLLSVRLQNSLHERCPPNCQDLLSWLPAHVVSKILSYLDPVSLARCSAVCR